MQASEGSGYAERFIRTLKENLPWVRTLETVEELRGAPHAFRGIYGAMWLIGWHGFRPPAAVRDERLPAAAQAAQPPIRYPTDHRQYNLGCAAAAV